jgi:RES domain-containing protein
MRVWRLVAERHVAAALSGEGAARYGGRWNRVGIRSVYTADSLALATLELAVHLAGAHVEFVAIELDVPSRSIAHLDVSDLDDAWPDDEQVTQPVGTGWINAGSSLAMSVPTTLVDHRSGERNVLFNPMHPRFDRIRELQRFVIEIDRRLA